DEELSKMLNGLIINRLILDYANYSPEKESVLLNVIAAIGVKCLCFKTSDIRKISANFDSHIAAILRFITAVPQIKIMYDKVFSMSSSPLQTLLRNEMKGFAKEFQNKLNNTGKVMVVLSEDPK
ncbi:hypothetical protein PMAYCL1PPCAC_05889, partial [Pristionchus mayeri]